MLQNARNQNVLAVRYDINFKLLAHHIFVNQNGVFDSLTENDVHIPPDVKVGVCDCHVLTADDIGRAQQNRKAESVCCGYCLITGHDSHALGSLEAETLQKRVKTLSVLSHINAFGRGSENFNAHFVQKACQLDCSLTAERNNNAVGLFNLNDVHNVLSRQRLKIEPVRRVKVG